MYSDKFKKRCIMEAKLMISQNFTIREVAKIVGLSKSTIHTERSELQKNKIPKYIELPQFSKDSMPVRVTLAVRM